MSRHRTLRRNVRNNPGDGLLEFLRDGERMKIHASTSSGRKDLEQWRTTLQKTLTTHEEIVRTTREALDLIGASLGEVAA